MRNSTRPGVRRHVAFATAVLALAGCGYPEDEPGAASPRETFELFVTAAQEGDPKGEALVSRRLDRPERETFVRAMAERVEPLSSGYQVVVDERLDAGTAVVAAAGVDARPPGAFAAVVVKKGETWFVAPPGLDLIYGVLATHGTTRAAEPRVDFEVNTAGQPRWTPDARVWLDGVRMRLQRRKLPRSVRFVAVVSRLEKGPHSVVAFARVAERVHAIAWKFRGE